MHDDWGPVIDGLAAARADARRMGGAAKLDAREAAGRGNARTWIDHLLDPGSFTEVGLLVGEVPADAFVGGYGTIDGRPVVVGAEDFTVLGGSVGGGTSAKRHRLAELAGQERVPLVMLLEGAGARVEADGAPMPRMPFDIQEFVAISGQVPMVTAVMGTAAGHSALAAPLADFVVMTADGALFAGGPTLVRQALGEVVDKHALGGPEVHTVHSGVAHNAVATAADALDLIRRYLSFFPSNAWEAPPARPDGADVGPRSLDEVLDLIPADKRKPYDVRPVIAALVDGGDFLEVSPAFGPSLVVGLARLGGEPVAIVANQPSVMAGSITSDAADKGAHFIEVADSFHLPLVFLTDNPGVLPGSASERAGILRHGARMYMTQVRAQVPKFQVALGKSFGFGAAIMAKVPFDRQTINLAIPGGLGGALPARAGREVAKLDDRAGDEMAAEQSSASYGAAKRLYVDDVIDPRELRDVLLAGLRLTEARRRGPHAPVARTGITP